MKQIFNTNFYIVKPDFFDMILEKLNHGLLIAICVWPYLTLAVLIVYILNRDFGIKIDLVD